MIWKELHSRGLRRRAAGHGQLIVLLTALLVWHHTYVLWHLAGGHHHAGGSGSSCPAAGSHSSHGHTHSHPNPHGHTHAPPEPSSARAAGSPARDISARKRYGHFAAVVHTLQHELASTGLLRNPHEHFSEVAEPELPADEAPSSPKGEENGEHRRGHSAGDHLVGFYSGSAPSTEGVLTWQTGEAQRTEPCPGIRQPYVHRPTARAPPAVS